MILKLNKKKPLIKAFSCLIKTWFLNNKKYYLIVDNLLY